MFSATCASCGQKGHIGGVGGNFAMRGKYNGYPAVVCASCRAGQYVTNAGRAVLSRRAKTRLIPDDDWKQMVAQWDQMFPND